MTEQMRISLSGSELANVKRYLDAGRHQYIQVQNSAGLNSGTYLISDEAFEKVKHLLSPQRQGSREVPHGTSDGFRYGDSFNP